MMPMPYLIPSITPGQYDPHEEIRKLMDLLLPDDDQMPDLVNENGTIYRDPNDVKKPVTKWTPPAHSPKLCQIVDQIKEICLAHKLAAYGQYPPHKVGVHKDNRFGFGVISMEMQALGNDIVSMGWSDLETRHASAFEDDDAGTIALFTAKLQASSPLFGKSDPRDIQIGSVACSHTNQFLCAVLDGADTEYASLGEDGKISKSKLFEDEKMQAAAEKGLTWFVFKKGVEKMHPKLPGLVQQRHNQPGQVARVVSIFQTLVGMHHQMNAMSVATGGSVDFDKLLYQAQQASPKLFHDLPGASAWLQKWGGKLTKFLIRILTRILNTILILIGILIGILIRILIRILVRIIIRILRRDFWILRQ